MKSNLKPPPIYKVIVSQTATALLLAVLMLLIMGREMAYSALIGGLICAIPNAYFAMKTFMYTGARSVDKMVRSIYTGEAVKLLLTAAGFALTFVFLSSVNIVCLFTAYFIVYIAGIVSTLRMQQSISNS
ncbi:MAG: F0F1 ATP synthase subunit I [SAR86 cluster bacterium]|uniref:F0F1 ATP synthase subunit I n=1 Tax=SAR86 cluster bacterium TaxID=2030880 RepID=A0A2A4MRL1_9GAMM|nr:MAG: F0F1 ATP synthase subunit I [SAR86 cluster bacterium]